MVPTSDPLPPYTITILTLRLKAPTRTQMAQYATTRSSQPMGPADRMVAWQKERMMGGSGGRGPSCGGGGESSGGGGGPSTDIEESVVDRLNRELIPADLIDKYTQFVRDLAADVLVNPIEDKKVGSRIFTLTRTACGLHVGPGWHCLYYDCDGPLHDT